MAASIKCSVRRNDRLGGAQFIFSRGPYEIHRAQHIFSRGPYAIHRAQYIFSRGPYGREPGNPVRELSGMGAGALESLIPIGQVRTLTAQLIREKIETWIF